jgi:acyl dehydratase
MSYEALKALEGTEVGVTDWMEITQERVDQFADATDDHQWIHVDPERAANGPFGGTMPMASSPSPSWCRWALRSNCRSRA